MLIKTVYLIFFLFWLFLGRETIAVTKSDAAVSRDIGVLVSDLLQQPSLADFSDVWSITVIDSDEMEHLYVRAFSKPFETLGGVCESKIQTFAYDSAKKLWTMISKDQGLRMTDSIIGCNYSLSANSFARISGGELKPAAFRDLQNIIARERPRLKRIGSDGAERLMTVPGINYNVDQSVVEMRFLSSGCVLTLTFDVDESGRPSIRRYSEDNLHCVKK
ncbi:MAG: hypothetical protein OEW73_09715 [Gammaproteobacteria bacterium]|nr:hypothetical protein [Gammaproteobacteria bacterium]MDH5262133.1 hypothetical protein [Gammaproteobacteria bacterium]